MALTKVNNRMIDGSYLNVKDFGATGDPSTTTVAAETDAIQDAINYASKNKIQTIFFPDGHYKYTTLRLYYDATDNPDFEQTLSRDGRFVFLGTGRISISDLRTYDGTSSTEGRLYGSVLESTSTGEGVIVDPNPSFASGSGNARNFLAEKMTFVADNNSYIVKAESCPMLSFEYCAFKQLNNDGNGVSARNAWFFTFNNCFLIGPSKTSAAGVGLEGSTGPDSNAIFGGLWSVDNSLIDTWNDCFKWTAGSFVNVSFRDTAIQNARNHSIHANSGTIQTLLLDNCYFENIPQDSYTNGVSFIKGNDDAIEKLQMNSCFMLGGGNTGNPDNIASAHLSGPCIDLDKVHSVSIDSTRIFRLSTTFLSINNKFSAPSQQLTSGFVRNTTVQHDSTDFSALTTPIYLVKTGSDVPLPVLENNRMNRATAGIEGVTDQDGVLQLYDSSSESIGELTDIGTGARSIPRLGVGEKQTATITDDITLSVTANTFQEFTVTTRNTSLSRNWRLLFKDDDRMIEGRLHVIQNSSSSTQSLDIRNQTPSGLINALAPGETGFYIAKIDRSAANNVDNGDTNGVLTFELFNVIKDNVIASPTTVNVKDYYHLTTNGTDWSPAFQAAIDALATSSDTYTGGIVFVPRGNYPIGSTITVDTTNAAALTSISIQGEGMHNTVIECSSGFTGTVAMDVTEATYCSFKDFHLFGGNPSNCDNGLRFVEGSEIQVERVFCQRFDDSGFLVERCFMMTFEQCRAKSCLTNFNFASHAGVSDGGYNTSIDCRNCYSVDPLTNGQGFYINDMTYSVFTACGSDMKGTAADRGYYGYRIGNVAGVAFNGCGAEGSGRSAYYFEASAALNNALMDGVQCSLNDCFSTGADARGGVGSYGSIYSDLTEEATDPSFINVSVKNFKENDVTGNVSVGSTGREIKHDIRLDNCSFINNPVGDVATLQPASAAKQGSTSITAANTPIFDLESIFGSTSIYSGVLHVIATAGTFATTGNRNLAAYVLLVTRGPGGSGVVEIAKNGLTTGASANWPSFTFSLDTTNAQLEASPVGSTSGSFHFYVSQVGGLRLEGV